MGRLCKSCSNEHREELDAKLRALYDKASGQADLIPHGAIGSLADEYGIVPTSLKRHLFDHLEPEWNGADEHRTARETHAAAMAAIRAARQVSVGAAISAAPDGVSLLLLSELTDLSEVLKDSIARCENERDERGISIAGSDLKGVIMARAKLLGLLEKRQQECPECPSVIDSPEFNRVLTVILGALTGHFEARAAVMDALRSVGVS